MEELDIVEIMVNPSFSSVNRVGWKGIILKKKDEHGEVYLSVQDKLGVSWPLHENEVKKIDHVNL